MSRVTNMTSGNPAKLILKFAFPLILTNIGQQFYTIVDTIIVGRGVGVEALAALGATDWLYWLVLWTVQALTQGFSVLVSQSFGANDRDELKKSITMSTLLCGVIALVLTIASVLAAKPLLLLLGTPANIFDGAQVYLTAMYIGTPVVMAYNMSAAILRGMGDGQSPLIAMGIAGLLNIVLDLLFVMVFGWGILGAAAATLLAQLFAFLYCAYVMRKLTIFSFVKSDWKPDTQILARLCHLGLPLALQHVVIVSGGIIAQGVINSCGFIFVAGVTATNKLHGLLDCSATAFGFAASTYMGQNWGAKKFDRIKTGLRSALGLSLVVAGAISVCIIVFGREVVSLFISASAENADQVLKISYDYLFIMSLFLPFAYIMHTYRASLQGIGKPLAPMLSGFFEFGARVGAALLLTRVIGESGLFFIDGAAWACAGIFLMGAYYWEMYRFRKGRST